MVSVRHAVTIGEWRADPATNELRRGQEVARLEPKSMDVLMRLAERAGEVVTREELFAAAWPGIVVGDEALSQSITKLRRALGDESRSPRYIETISKRGYRLVAPVTPEGAAAAAAPTPPRRALWMAATAIVVAILAGAAFLVGREAPEGAPADASAERAASWIAVTVLPFEWLGQDEAQAYFARGISDTLATELGKISGLRVISPSGGPPSYAFGRARYVVSGSVQRDATTLRVNARLVDTRSSEQLWAERYERPAAELFAVQDEIIAKLAHALPAKVTQSERARLARRYTRSLEAYDDFLRAQALFLARGSRENLEARELYRKAIERDPRFARAYAGLAMTHALEPRLAGATDAAASLERALQLAQTAREIDAEIAEVHWALGFIHTQARRYALAIESLQRAIDLNPSFADAYALMGGIHTYTGQPAKSVPLLRTALRLDPEGGYLYFLLLGRAYFFQGDTEQALLNLRAAAVRNPADLETHLYLAAALMASGNRAAAEWEAEEVRSLERGFSMRKWLESYPLASEPLRARLREPLSALFDRTQP